MHKNYQGFQSVESIGKVGEEKVLKLIGKDGEVLEVNELLWAVGRKPETDSLNLGLVGVTLGPKGHIAVDKFQNTSAEGIYALGDVTGQMELTPGTYFPSPTPPFHLQPTSS